MITDLEIYRAANQLVNRYGQDAEFEAAMRADAMIEAGDIDGQRVWQRILNAIDELQRDRPGLADRILAVVVAFFREGHGPGRNRDDARAGVMREDLANLAHLAGVGGCDDDVPARVERFTQR